MLLRTASIADTDVTESALWLERQQAGLGADFLAALRETFAEIRQSPLACPTLDLPGVTFKSSLRWRSVGKFPYLAIFTIQGDEILIIAVLHAHRDLEAMLRSRVGVT
jgi:plasmid stabilization system protein ParE